MQIAGEEELGRVYDWRLLKWVWSYVRPYRRLFWLSMLLMPLNSVLALTQPYILKLTIDIFLAARKTAAPAWLAPILRVSGSHGLLVMGALYLLLLIGELATFYGQFYLTMMVAQYSLSDLRLALFSHVERLQMAFFDRTPAGRLVSRMTSDIDAINEMFSSGSLTLLIDLLTLGGIVAIMFAFNAHLALWSLCAVPPLLILINFFRVRIRVVYRHIRECLAALNAYLAEALSGMAVVQLFTRERESQREFDDLNQQSRNVQRTSNIYDGTLYSTVEAMSSVTVAIIIWVGGGEVMHHLIGFGTLVAFIDYAQRFFTPLRDVSSKYTTLQSALASVERIEALMETRATIASPPMPSRIRPRRYCVRPCELRVPARRTSPAGSELPRRSRSKNRYRRPDRLGQDHDNQAPGAPLRRHLRPHPRRRCRRARMGFEETQARNRPASTGCLPLLRGYPR